MRIIKIYMGLNIENRNLKEDCNLQSVRDHILEVKSFTESRMDLPIL